MSVFYSGDWVLEITERDGVELYTKENDEVPQYLRVFRSYDSKSSCPPTRVILDLLLQIAERVVQR